MPTNAEMERSDAIAAARQKIKLIREGILVPDDPRISFKRHFVREGDRGSSLEGMLRFTGIRSTFHAFGLIGFPPRTE